MQQESLDREKPAMHLGKSEHGIYYTALIWHQLRVWVLREASESRPMPEWELKHTADIRPSFLWHYMREDREEIRTSWSLDRGKTGSDDQVDCGWDSSDDSVISVEGEDGIENGDRYCDMSRCMDFLGYHPRKEIAFLGDHFEGFAYYLSSSKLQYLGTFYPAGCCHRQVAATHESFIYTPCMDDLLPDQNRNTTHDYSHDDYHVGGEDGDLEEEEDDVDTDEEEDLEEDEVDTNEDEDLEKVEDGYFKGSEEDGDNDKDEEVDC
ncbi:hypothetical protein C2845_PM03G18660 [Panicum miliaceum]|uniref:Uncharacterized protein n=1 Tax=Panicum miliaceum TaxID=4540 RepID=A0A3L6TFF5_PANMI|nr:hypothetical protein C2845_PM03G18660 [Panicum miliaceum]